MFINLKFMLYQKTIWFNWLKIYGRPAIKENTAHVVAASQNNVSLLWQVILMYD